MVYITKLNLGAFHHDDHKHVHSYNQPTRFEQRITPWFD